MPYRLAIAHYIISYYKIRGWVVGLEPTISRTTIWRADQLHHTHHISVLGGIRTPDPRLRRPLLYPTELQAQAAGKVSSKGVGAHEAVFQPPQATSLTVIDYSRFFALVNTFCKNYFEIIMRPMKQPAAPTGRRGLR